MKSVFKIFIITSVVFISGMLIFSITLSMTINQPKVKNVEIISKFLYVMRFNDKGNLCLYNAKTKKIIKRYNVSKKDLPNSDIILLEKGLYISSKSSLIRTEEDFDLK